PSALRTFRDFLQSPFLYKTVLNRKPAYLSGLAPMTDTDRPIGIDSCLLSYVANVPLPDTTCLTKGNVRLLKSGFLFFTISVDAPASTALNLTQNCYPNWEARIDGQDVPIRTTNLAFMSVRVPAGVHVVEWRYRPRAVMASIPVSIAVLVLSLFLLVRKRRRIH
ncbi:MAG: hypothetical protein JWP27_1192, partial [Flaviaesturariibacter sp.]|nr:hypothetical protein [Flaviaesturariibacter sp.]